MAAISVSPPDGQPFSFSMMGDSELFPQSSSVSPGRQTAKRTRIPREGPAGGGGRLTVMDRSVFDGQLREVFPTEEERPIGLSPDKTRRNRRPSVPAASARSVSSGDAGFAKMPMTKGRASKSAISGFAESPSPRSSAGGGAGAFGGFASFEQSQSQQFNQQERKAQEMFHKWEKAEAVRERDQKRIVEQIDKKKDMREARFKRLLSNLGGEGTLAYETAVDLREREERQDVRRQSLYNEWEDKVYQPLLLQAHKHLNPPDRKYEQALSGTKSVGWTLPGETVRLVHKVTECPARRPVVEHARENAFHEAAERVLGRSQSAPQLSRASAVSAKATLGGSFEPPNVRMDPTAWTQTVFQSTMYGHFAQKSEHGPGFKGCIRSGPNAHLPDESDGVPVAGTRFSRISGYHDKGILVGDRASRGETSDYKSWHGPSCGAPAQDHFTFEASKHITDLEFPKGRRPPPPETLR